MLTKMTQKYKITCDRCGKECIREEGVMDDTVFRHISISNEVSFLARADLCGECYEELCEFVENFFDEVNCVNEGVPEEKPKEKPKVKPKAIYLGFSQHDCESHYRCPLCGDAFGSWCIDMKDVRCPNCKAELGGIQ